MARYPGATWRPLAENATEPLITPTQVILHSAVSTSDSLYGYFNRASVTVESHLYVQADGDAEQYIDTARQADANYRANIRALSVETWDDAHPDRIGWTEPQMARMVDFVVWAHRTHGIPIRWAPAWNAPGVGYHTLYPGIWTPVSKTCPGLARRGQVAQVISRALAIASGAIAPIMPSPSRPDLTPTPVTLNHQCRRGDRDADVTWAQLRLVAHGVTVAVDGDFGPATEAGVKTFQSRKGLAVDGVVGPKTSEALTATPVVVVHKPAPAPAPVRYPPPLPAFPLPRGYYFGPKDGPNESVSGYHGRVFAGRTDTAWLQMFGTQMSHRGWSVGKGKVYLGRYGNDGMYGAEYEALAMAFQRDQRFTPDGLIGAATWTAASRNPIR